MTLRNDELIELLFSILLPPVGVFLRRGCGPDLVVNILLTVLGYIPGENLICSKPSLFCFLSVQPCPMQVSFTLFGSFSTLPLSPTLHSKEFNTQRIGAIKIGEISSPLLFFLEAVRR